MRTIGAAAVEVLQHFVGIDEKYFEALTTSFVSQGLSQVRFPHAGRTAYKRIVMLTYEIATGHLQYQLSIQIGIEVEVKVFQGLGSVDRGTSQAQA